MGLNPSNRLDGDLKGFPTLGDPPFSAKCKDAAVAELRAAGFPRGSETLTLTEHKVYKEGSKAHQMASAGVHVPGMAGPDDTEWVWVYVVEAKLHFWKFYRAWYYWVAEACNSDYYIPKDIAHAFNQTFRLDARVEGFAGGQDVRSGVSSYHVDTPVGLDALMLLLKERERKVRAEQMSSYDSGRA